MSDVFCTNCGTKSEPGSVFCENCGMPLDGDSGSAAPEPVLQDAPSQAGPISQTAAQPPRRSGKSPMIAIVVIVMVAIAIVAFIMMQQGDSEEEGGNANQQSQAQSSSTSQTATDEPSHAAASSVSVAAPQFTTVTTSSVLPPDSTTSDYGGMNVVDGIVETAWNEGAAGDGTGEWIELYASTPQHVTSVSIMGGYPKPYRDGSDVYYKNNRPRQVTISYDGGSQTFLLQDLRAQFQTCTLSRPVETSFIRITINSVYKGANYDDCCIAEVKVS